MNVHMSRPKRPAVPMSPNGASVPSVVMTDGTVRACGDAPNYGRARAPGAVALLPAA